MDSPWLGLIELFVVLLFALGWGILELFTLRLDKRRKAQASRQGRVTNRRLTSRQARGMRKGSSAWTHLARNRSRDRLSWIAGPDCPRSRVLSSDRA